MLRGASYLNRSLVAKREHPRFARSTPGKTGDGYLSMMFGLFSSGDQHYNLSVSVPARSCSLANRM